MRYRVIFSIGSLATLLTIAPAFAQTPNQPMSKDAPAAAAPAGKPGMLAMPHRMTGQVVAADQSSNTLTVRDTKGKELTFNADSDTAAKLNGLKAGDRIRVTYKKGHNGELVATHITEQPATKATR